MFDSWDGAQKSGDDTEANTVAIAMCIGGAMVMARGFVARLRLCVSLRRVRTYVAESLCPAAEVLSCQPEIALSPPVSLRI